MKCLGYYIYETQHQWREKQSAVKAHLFTGAANSNSLGCLYETLLPKWVSHLQLKILFVYGPHQASHFEH